MDMYDKIDSILAELSLSRRQLAIAAGISENTLAGAFRRRTKNFSVENVIKIANVLGVSWLELVGKPEMEQEDREFLENVDGEQMACERLPDTYQTLEDMVRVCGYLIRKIDGKFVLDTPDGVYNVQVEDLDEAVKAARKAAVLQLELIAQREHQEMLRSTLAKKEE